jgi:hypothetical protein
VFLGILSTINLIVYEAGIAWGFSEQFNTAALNALTFEGICLGIGSCYGIVLDGYLLVRRRAPVYLLGICGYIFLSAFGFAIAALAAFFEILLNH